MTQSMEGRFQHIVDGWHSGLYSRMEVADVVFECLMESGDVSFFRRTPEEFKTGIIETLESFRRTGNAEWIVAHTGMYIDRAAEMRKLLGLMAEANLIDGGEIKVVPPPPVIDGMEFIVDGTPLLEILSYDPRLLDCSIEAYSIGRESTSTYRNQAEFSMLVTHNLRDWRNETSFRRIAKSCWLATFSLFHVIGELAPERNIVEHSLVSVVSQLAGRRKYFEVKIYDLFGHAIALRCKEIRLCSLKQLQMDDETIRGRVDLG